MLQLNIMCPIQEAGEPEITAFFWIAFDKNGAKIGRWHARAILENSRWIVCEVPMNTKKVLGFFFRADGKRSTSKVCEVPDIPGIDDILEENE